MLVSLEQSLAEPADSIIHFLCVFACVFQPMVHALKTTQPEELDPLLACLPKYNQTKKVFLAKCHRLDVAVKLLLNGFESIRGFANLGNEARGMDGFGRCVCD